MTIPAPLLTARDARRDRPEDEPLRLPRDRRTDDAAHAGRPQLEVAEVARREGDDGAARAAARAREVEDPRRAERRERAAVVTAEDGRAPDEAPSRHGEVDAVVHAVAGPEVEQRHRLAAAAPAVQHAHLLGRRGRLLRKRAPRNLLSLRVDDPKVGEADVGVAVERPVGLERDRPSRRRAQDALVAELPPVDPGRGGRSGEDERARADEGGAPHGPTSRRTRW